ncbi:MAG TPA: DNA-3-methyladenine glycosylase [Candidatus Saccharimonadales bacterium]|nr:DNA-3-methyladenine glycosylase [Candidatus Saccharimonadales bacterium]
MQDFSILHYEAEDVAPRLLGCALVRELDGERLECSIVETEAYSEKDAASHSYRGITPRTQVMFGPAGYLYVYFTYGMHYCANIVVARKGYGAAVLVRAVEPLRGTPIIEQRRNGKHGPDLTNGPAKVCYALGIDAAFNGHNLLDAPLQLHIRPSLQESRITQTTRIGISKAVDKPWRFYIKDNPYVSKP